MKSYLHLFFMLCASVMVGCSASDEASSFNPGYEQYGTAFASMPKREDAVIYQVNVRAFSQDGTLNGVKARLQQIKELGANVIYLMPVYPVGVLNAAGEMGSPYAVKDYKAVNPEFGSLEDLRSLVDAAHSMGMAVILDWVANHTSWDNNWITEHPEWYTHNDAGDIIAPEGTNWTDVADLDYSNTDMRAAMTDAMAYWVYNANIDGFRCDTADFVPQSFWSDAITKLRTIKKQDILMLAEGSRANHFDAGFDYTFGFSFFDALKKVYNENKPATTLQDANATEYTGTYTPDRRIVRYTSNHDVNLSDGSSVELFKGKPGSMVAFAVASTMKSIPMIYNGQEIGWAPRIDYFNRTPIDWSTADADLLAEYKKIIAFRNSSQALKTGTFTGYSTGNISAYTMESGTEKVLVIANLTNSTSNYLAAPAISSVNWTDGLNGTQVSLSSSLTLQPYQYYILKN